MPIVILNGPPRSGKDSIANILQEAYSNVAHVKFANILKVMTHRLYGTSYGDTPYGYEEVKDIPNDDFLGLTPRQAYIAVSENYIKPVHGTTFFGTKLANILIDSEVDLIEQVVVVSDGGFDDEVKPLIDRFGADKIMILPLYREGCSFNGDSRSYLDTELFSKLGVEILPAFHAGTGKKSFARLSPNILGHLQLDCNHLFKQLKPKYESN